MPRRRTSSGSGKKSAAAAAAVFSAVPVEGTTVESEEPEEEVEEVEEEEEEDVDEEESISGPEDSDDEEESSGDDDDGEDEDRIPSAKKGNKNAGGKTNRKGPGARKTKPPGESQNEAKARCAEMREQGMALLHTLDLDSREAELNDQGRRTLRDPEDEEYISPLNCLIRSQIEVVVAGRNHSKAFPGQVGLRCVHCADDDGLAEYVKGVEKFTSSKKLIEAAVRNWHVSIILLPLLCLLQCISGDLGLKGCFSSLEYFQYQYLASNYNTLSNPSSVTSFPIIRPIITANPRGLLSQYASRHQAGIR